MKYIKTNQVDVRLQIMKKPNKSKQNRPVILPKAYDPMFHSRDEHRIRQLEEMQKNHENECLKKQEEETINWR